jgi:hypothetical protein
MRMSYAVVGHGLPVVLEVDDGPVWAWLEGLGLGHLGGLDAVLPDEADRVLDLVQVVDHALLVDVARLAADPASHHLVELTKKVLDSLGMYSAVGQPCFAVDLLVLCPHAMGVVEDAEQLLVGVQLVQRGAVELLDQLAEDRVVDRDDFNPVQVPDQLQAHRAAYLPPPEEF